MKRTILRPGLWALTVGLAGAATVSASSITTYGSIVLSTLGTEGMAAATADSSLAQPAMMNTAAESAATVGASNGAVVNNLAPIMNGSGTKPAPGGGSGGGSPSSRPSPPVAAAGNPAVDSSTAEITTTQVPVPAVSDVLDTPSLPPSDVVVEPVGSDDSTTKEDIPAPPVDTKVDNPDNLYLGPPIQVPVNDTATADTAGSDTTRTPEPATLTLLGLAGVGGWWRARRKK